MSTKLELEQAPIIGGNGTIGWWVRGPARSGGDRERLAWFNREQDAQGWAESHQPESEVEVQLYAPSSGDYPVVLLGDRVAVQIPPVPRSWLDKERRSELAEMCAKKMREWEAEQ